LLYLPAILIGRLLRFAVRLVRPGGGSAFPGLVLSKLAPNLVYKAFESFPKGLVVITGTAGKSTTTKMVVGIARAHGLEVFTNPSTANIEQGFFSTILKYGNLFGKVPGDIAIMEMDEGHAASLALKVKPRISIILNVFEDQLDRFIDPALVREKLSIVASATTETVLLNADDQNCLLIAQQVGTKARFFSIARIGSSAKSEMKYARTYLPEIRTPQVDFDLLTVSDRAVKIRAYDNELSFELPAKGLHFALDGLAAVAVSREILKDKIDIHLTEKAMNEMPPVFSRAEIIQVNGEPVEFILVQNPISMELNLANLSADLSQVFFAIGRDVHDPSWLWTVDMSAIGKVSMVSGFNYADAALLLSYQGIAFDRVEPDYFKAIDEFLALPKPAKGHKTVIYSADAMRRLRRYKGFTDPEDVTRV